MIRRSLLISAVVLGSVISFSGAAQAGTADVHFGGTVPSSCTFGAIQNGTLGLNVAGTTLSSDPLSGGTAGSTSVTCNNITATLTADNPAQSIAPTGYDHTQAVKTFSVVGAGANVVAIATPSTPTPIPLPGTTNLTVNMTTTTAALLPSGNYDFFVRLTLAP